MKRIIGYVNTADLNHMREEDVRALTVINIAFGLIRDGEVVWDAKDARDGIVSIRKSNPELKIVLSVGGWGADGFSQAARTKEGMMSRHLLETALQIIRHQLHIIQIPGGLLPQRELDRKEGIYPVLG